MSLTVCATEWLAATKLNWIVPNAQLFRDEEWPPTVFRPPKIHIHLTNLASIIRRPNRGIPTKIISMKIQTMASLDRHFFALLFKLFGTSITAFYLPLPQLQILSNHHNLAINVRGNVFGKIASAASACIPLFHALHFILWQLNPFFSITMAFY